MQKSILIDATHVAGDQPTGVEAYARGLLPPLSEQLMSLGWTVAWIGHEPAAPYGTPKGVEWVSSPYTRFWGQLGLLQVLRARKPGLFYTPSGAPPVLYAGKTALTVHDLGLYADPASYSIGQAFRLGPLLKRAARRAAMILVPSSYTQHAVSETWKIPVDRTVLTYETADVTKDASQAVPGLPDSFILYVGRIERKKNLEVLLRGFAKLESDVHLVLAGKDGYGAQHLKKIAGDKVHFTGYISEGQKKWLYERAVMVVVPCRIEGFGIPVLEAFAYRAPALCAQSGALPEVGGNAAWYAQGDIPTDWYLQMKRLLEDEPLRRQLVAAGTKRLEEFSWLSTAKIAAGRINAL